MKETDETRIKELLQETFEPVSAQLPRDLWPQMLRLLDQRAPTRVVPWFDWALVAMVTICVLAVPHSIPVLLYYL